MLEINPDEPEVCIYLKKFKILISSFMVISNCVIEYFDYLEMIWFVEFGIGIPQKVNNSHSRINN